MATPTPRRFVIFGGTGRRGGSVLRHLLPLLPAGDVAVGVSRTPASAEAKALHKEFSRFACWGGFVAGDLDSPASLPRLLQGAHAVFLPTLLPVHLDVARDARQSRAVMAAAAAAAVNTLVFTGCAAPPPALVGLSPMHDVRHASEEFLLSSACAGVVNRVSVRTAVYYSAVASVFAPTRNADLKTYTLALPLGRARVAMLDVADLGGLVAPVLLKPSPYAGQCIAATGDFLSGADLAAAVSAAVGVKVTYEPVDPDVYAKGSAPLAPFIAGLGRVLQAWDAEGDGVAARLAKGHDPLLRQLHKKALTFAQWLATPQALADVKKVMLLDRKGW